MSRGSPRPPRIDAAALRDAALAYLARFDASPERLRGVLERRVRRAQARDAELSEERIDAARSAIAALVREFTEAGVVDARAYAERRLRRALRAGKPPIAAEALAAQAGGDRDAARAAKTALLEDDPDAEMRAAAAYLRKRRLGAYAPDNSPKAARDTALTALARRGFGRSVAAAAADADRDALDALTPV